MHVSLIFWLALLLPGYVIVRYLCEEDLRSGLLGVVGLSYLAVFGLLSPVSILCYIFEAPMFVFSAACVVVILAGAVEISHRQWWQDIGRLFACAVGLELVIVAVDLLMGARVGALVGGDAITHLARIRTLLQHGFSNYDPFTSGEHFYPTYHTNILHALHAACAQVTGIGQRGVWFASLPLAKILIASGAYYLAWCIFDRRYAAWAAALFVVACHGPVSFVLYPNKLAPLWIAPMMIGFAIRAVRRTCTWVAPLKLGVASLVLGQVHSLYAAFAGIVLGPTLAVYACVRIWRRQRDRWATVACVAALGAASPFLLISKASTDHRSDQMTVNQATVTQTADGTKDTPDRMAPRAGWGTVHGWRFVCLAVGIICALAGPRRRSTGVFLAVVGVAVMFFYVPSLYSVAVQFLKKTWILGRMGFVLYLGFVIFVPASFAFFIGRRTKKRWVHSIITSLAFILGIAFARRAEPYTWAIYYNKAIATKAERESPVTLPQSRVGFCEEVIPHGATVLADGWVGMSLAAVCDCRLVAPGRGGAGVSDIGQRREDLARMTAPGTPWKVRQRLLRKYDITLFCPHNLPFRWVEGHKKQIHRHGGFTIIELDTD